MYRPLSRFRRLVAPAVVVVLASGSCGDTEPSSGLAAPALVSPTDDAIAVQPPTMTVSNVTSTAAGARVYDFQLADNQAAVSGSGGTLVASANGVTEGASGQTSWTVQSPPLARGRRFYWRSRAVQNGMAGAWSPSFRFRTDVAPNPAPVIQTLGASSDRAETNAEIALAPVVQDAETSPASLLYEWTATGGSFTTSGQTARWRAPAGPAPTSYDVTLTVIERYTITDPDGRPEMRENRTSARMAAHVNNSPEELATLALTFVDDFIHSERSPEYCVRNFSDNCRGKQEELGDIQRNRQNYTNHPQQSSYSLQSIDFQQAGNSPHGATIATVRVRCRFAATEKATGKFGIAEGTCRLPSVYENHRWWLCESRFEGVLPPQLKGFIF